MKNVRNCRADYPVNIHALLLRDMVGGLGIDEKEEETGGTAGLCIGEQLQGPLSCVPETRIETRLTVIE